MARHPIKGLYCSKIVRKQWRYLNFLRPDYSVHHSSILNLFLTQNEITFNCTSCRWVVCVSHMQILKSFTGGQVLSVNRLQFSFKSNWAISILFPCLADYSTYWCNHGGGTEFFREFFFKLDLYFIYPFGIVLPDLLKNKPALNQAGCSFLCGGTD